LAKLLGPRFREDEREPIQSTGGLVGILGDAGLHHMAPSILPEADWLSFVLGCVWMSEAESGTNMPAQ
jgi:hypothetical protein